jgi:KaiC/GvpD/RAD55 family RecA-like ATPase
MTDWTLLEAARSYAERGWFVFPVHSIVKGRCTCGRSNCEHPGKHPRTDHGFHDATTSDDQITAWWYDWPTANIGIRTGETSRLAVVDVDPRNGGLESMAALDLPETATAQTGGGGFHYFYKLSHPLKGHTLAKGIDLQADGDYVVASPSSHILGQYTWLIETDLKNLPTIFMNGAAPATPGGFIVQPDSKTWVAERLTVPCEKGSRHNTLTKLAGYFRNVVPEPVALAILGEWNENFCEPMLDPIECQKTIHDLYVRYPGTIDQPIELWTVSSLLRADFPPLTWIVDGLLPEGLVFLAGRPKRGKSWLALQVALDVVSGTNSLGETASGRVLYIALEDSPRRLQSRLQQMRAGESSDLIFINELPNLDNGGGPRLIELMDSYHPVLIVIDTLARVMGRKRDADSASDMTDLLSPLQIIAGQRHCCILLIDHHRKPGAEIVDMIDDIAGSTAKTAVADAIIGLYRKSGEQTAQLKITGRDVEEKELTLRWDAMRFYWRVEEDAVLTTTELAVIAFIRDVREAKSVTIASQLTASLRTIQWTLGNLVTKGFIERVTLETGKRGAPSFIYRLKASQ